MDPIEKLVQEVSFPRAGELFAVVLKPYSHDVEEPLTGTVTQVTQHDRSYRDRIFRCLASDASRVVATVAHGYDYSHGEPTIFYRPECIFDDVSLIAPALGLTKQDGD